MIKGKHNTKTINDQKETEQKYINDQKESEHKDYQ
jgi:hypothetical protein